MADLPTDALAYKPENREKIRRAIAAVVEKAVRDAGTKLISVERVKGAGASDQNATTKLLKLWREGALSVADSWDDRPSSSGGGEGDAGEPDADKQRAELAKRIREAGTDGDREAVLHELAAMVAAGVIGHEAANSIRGATQEARHASGAKRANEPPPEDPTKLLLASPEAMEVARAMDLLVSDERFDRCCAFVAAEVEADLLESPNTDEGGAR